MTTYPVFVPKQNTKGVNPYSGYPICFLTGNGPQISGDIGIEVEVEGNKFPKSGLDYGNSGAELIPLEWRYTHDGSLRGEDNAEYVFRQPMKFDEVGSAINNLWDMFANYGSVLSESNRTSVHVHLNVQGFHLNRLAAFCGMYFAVEDILTHWCGEHRVGNLFCMRAKDAPATITHLKRFIQSEGQYSFPNGMHYAGLNPGAIKKFGSVEIRALRGVNDPQTILDWVAVLRRLYDLSADYRDPRSVVAGFSGEGPIAWLERILGDKCGVILNECPYNTDEIRNSLYEGIRLAQDLCYCRDWSEYVPVTPEADPFGRLDAPVSASSFNTVSLETYASVLGSSNPPSAVWSSSGLLSPYYTEDGGDDEPEMDIDIDYDDDE